MCEYSLHAVIRRDAKVNDRLVVSKFPRTATVGFHCPNEDNNMAVCMKPGTQLAFTAPVRAKGGFFLRLFGLTKTYPSEATFKQLDTENHSSHRDGLEFANGTFVLIQKIEVGQMARVLQLPVDLKNPPIDTVIKHKANPATSVRDSETTI